MSFTKIRIHEVDCPTPDDLKRAAEIDKLLKSIEDAITNVFVINFVGKVTNEVVKLFKERTDLLKENEKLSKENKKLIARLSQLESSLNDVGNKQEILIGTSTSDKDNMDAVTEFTGGSIPSEEEPHQKPSPSRLHQQVNASERTSGSSYNDGRLSSQRNNVLTKSNVSHQSSGQREPSQVEHAIIEAWTMEWHELISVPKLRDRISALPFVISAEVQNSPKMLIVRTNSGLYSLPLRLDYEYCENAYSAETPPGSSSTVQKLITLARVDSSGTVIQRGHLVITG